MIHSFNIAIHVIAGTIALIIGIVAIVVKKPSIPHTRFGRYFLVLLSIVVTSGFLGWLFFRSNSFLLMLTLIAGYVGYAGYRSVKLKEKRTNRIDASIAVIALGLAWFYLIWLKTSDGNWSPSVIYPTVTGIALVTIYDLLKHFWFYPSIKHWWLYEHIYKMISAFSAILSAFVGTVLPNFKPLSQIGPSIFCVWLIIFFITVRARRNSKLKRTTTDNASYEGVQ